MSIPASAAFLSYASEDAEPAQRIADALRAAGVEVWFDRSELRGGDAWDRNIRHQIHHCQLFLPIISAHSEARDEGYFRREWALAEARTRDMSHKRAFLVPVVIDGTSERDAAVPEKFLDVQWTRLPGGNADPAFVERVKRLITAEVVPSPPPASFPSEQVIETTPSRAHPPRWLVGAAVAAAAAALVVGYITYGKREARAPAQTAASIAVLPLANESGDPNQQYLSDGLSENLITALTQFPGLKVIGRTSAFQFRDSKEDAHSIGAKLGVTRLLEGSVQRSGDAVRVRAELIDTADGSTQWSERYDRSYKDLFALQDDITRAVAEALRAKLLPGQHAQAQDERPPSGNVEAYNALLQGRFFIARGTDADVQKSIGFFTRGTQLDPQYAIAWSELAGAWTLRGQVFLEDAQARRAAFSKAREAADTALGLSPNLAAPHLARGGLLHALDLDWRGAEAEYRRGLELAPNSADAKASLAFELAALGEVEQAVDLAKQAIATEPLRDDYYFNLAVYFSGLSRLDEGERAIRRAIELQPAAVLSHWQLAVIEVQRGNAQAALDAARSEAPGVNQDAAVAIARQIGDDRSSADAALRKLIAEHAKSTAYEIAEVYALRRDADNTFAWLDRAWSNRESDIAYLLYDPFILRFKDDPRFAAFCRKVGLPVPGEKRDSS